MEGLAGADEGARKEGILLVGDDVFVTNPEILARGIADGVGNALLVKLNQIGTLTETLDAVRMAQTSGCRTIVRTLGTTPDDTIADLAVAVNSGLIRRVGCRGERSPRSNRLLAIEEELEGAGTFAGRGGLSAMKADDDADAPHGPRPMTAFLDLARHSSVIIGVLLYGSPRARAAAGAHGGPDAADRQIVERRAENEALKASIDAASRHEFPAEKVAREELHPGSARRRRTALPGRQPDEAGRHARAPLPRVPRRRPPRPPLVPAERPGIEFRRRPAKTPSPQASSFGRSA